MRRETRDDTGEDRLDELLAQARWPEPPSESTERLRRQWLSMRSPSVARRLIWAAAAAVLIAIGSAVWFTVRSERIETPTRSIVQVPDVKVEAPPRRASVVASRASTLPERLALLSSPATRSKPPAPPKREPDDAKRVQLAIDFAAHGKVADAVARLKPLSPADVESRLIEIASNGDLRQRHGATRLLAETSVARSLPVLVQLAHDPNLAAAATLGVSRLGGAPAVTKLARTAKSRVTRHEAARALLARGDADGTDAFLALVLDPTTRDDAMAALDAAPEPGVRSLLAALDHRRVDYRLAAAKSLGSVCDHGGIEARLQQMVRENDNRREALAALVSCPGKPAADFLRAARERPSIESEVRAVQSELADIFRT